MLSGYYDEIFSATGDNIVALNLRVARVAGRDYIVEAGLTDLRGQAIYQSFVNPLIRVRQCDLGGELAGITRKDLSAAPALTDVIQHLADKLQGRVVVSYAFARARAILQDAGLELLLHHRILDIETEFSAWRGEYDANRGRLRRFCLSVAAMYFEGFEPCPLRDEYLDPRLTRWFPLRGEYSCGSIYRCRQILTVMRGLAATALGRTGYRMCSGVKYF